MRFKAIYSRSTALASAFLLLLCASLAAAQPVDLGALAPTQNLLRQSVREVEFLSLPRRADPRLVSNIQRSLAHAGLSTEGYCRDNLLVPIYSSVSGVYADNPLTAVAWESLAVYCRAADGIGATLVAVDAVSRELSDASQFGKVKQLRATAVVGKVPDRATPEQTPPTLVVFRKEWYSDNAGPLESYGDLLDVTAGYDLQRQSTIEPFPLIVDPAGLLVLAKTLPEGNEIAGKDVYLVVQGEISLVKVRRNPPGGAPGSGFQLDVQRTDGAEILSVLVAPGANRGIESVEIPGLVLNQVLSIFPNTPQ